MLPPRQPRVFARLASCNEMVFSPWPDRSFLIALGRISCQDLLNKMLKDHDERAVIGTVGCLMGRNLTHIHDYFK